MDKKVINRGIWLLGIRINRNYYFDTIEIEVIKNKNLVAYLILNGNTKVFLIKNISEPIALKKIESIAKKHNINLN